MGYLDGDSYLTNSSEDDTLEAILFESKGSNIYISNNTS